MIYERFHKLTTSHILYMYDTCTSIYVCTYISIHIINRTLVVVQQSAIEDVTTHNNNLSEKLGFPEVLRVFHLIHKLHKHISTFKKDEKKMKK